MLSTLGAQQQEPTASVEVYHSWDILPPTSEGISLNAFMPLQALSHHGFNFSVGSAVRTQGRRNRRSTRWC